MRCNKRPAYPNIDQLVFRLGYLLLWWFVGADEFPGNQLIIGRS